MTAVAESRTDSSVSHIFYEQHFYCPSKANNSLTSAEAAPASVLPLRGKHSCMHEELQTAPQNQSPAYLRILFAIATEVYHEVF